MALVRPRLCDSMKLGSKSHAPKRIHFASNHFVLSFHIVRTLSLPALPSLLLNVSKTWSPGFDVTGTVSTVFLPSSFPRLRLRSWSILYFVMFCAYLALLSILSSLKVLDSIWFCFQCEVQLNFVYESLSGTGSKEAKGVVCQFASTPWKGNGTGSTGGMGLAMSCWVAKELLTRTRLAIEFLKQTEHVTTTNMPITAKLRKIISRIYQRSFEHLIQQPLKIHWPNLALTTVFGFSSEFFPVRAWGCIWGEKAKYRAL